jgi:SAM-dependent methyltransferase
VIASELTWEAASLGLRHHVLDLLERERPRSVCEVGAGRSPLLSAEEVERLGLAYTLLDVSAQELALAPDGFVRRRADICDPAAVSGERYDFVFSIMLAEHVPDGRRMHENVFALLRPGGLAFHFFPTLWTPVFVLNRLLPEALARPFLDRFYPRTWEKFPARYSWCRGPTPRMVSRLRGVGFRIEEFREFYGTGYLERVPVLRCLDRRLTAWAARRRVPYLTSYAYLVLRKPEEATSEGPLSSAAGRSHVP